MQITNNAIILDNGEIYQVSNITQVKTDTQPRPISRTISLPIFTALLVLGLITLNQPSTSEYGKIISIFSIGMIMIDLSFFRKGILTLYLNDGRSESFVTADSKGLKNVKEIILDSMNNRGNLNTESIVHICDNKPVKIIQNHIQDQRKYYDSSIKSSGNVNGNIITGKGSIIDRSVSAGRDLIGKVFTSSVNNASSNDAISAQSHSLDLLHESRGVCQFEIE